eukprot:6182901-Pleurochrysis_carterae.AAC.3
MDCAFVTRRGRRGCLSHEAGQVLGKAARLLSYRSGCNPVREQYFLATRAASAGKGSAAPL